MYTGFQSEDLKIRHHLGYQGIYQRIMLKWGLNETGVEGANQKQPGQDKKVWRHFVDIASVVQAINEFKSVCQLQTCLTKISPTTEVKLNKIYIKTNFVRIMI